MHDGLSIQQETFAARMARLGGSLGAAGQRVAGFHRWETRDGVGRFRAGTGANAGTSDATVIRTIQTLGYAGLADLKRALAASLDLNATPADDMRRTLADLGEDAMQSLDTIMAAHAEALETVRSEGFREQMGRPLSVLHGAERIVVSASGHRRDWRAIAVLLARVGRRSSAWMRWESRGGSDREQAITILDRISRLRIAVSGQHHDLG